MRFLQFVREFHREESGQDMLEYALVIVAVLGAVVAGSGTLSGDLTADLAVVDGKIQAAINSMP
jgi:Flp pilus assembly pilin Flp